MSLKEDMICLGRHIKNGTGKAYLLGTTKPLPNKSPALLDQTRIAGFSFYEQLSKNGD